MGVLAAGFSQNLVINDLSVQQHRVIVDDPSPIRSRPDRRNPRLRGNRRRNAACRQLRREKEDRELRERERANALARLPVESTSHTETAARPPICEAELSAAEKELALATVPKPVNLLRDRTLTTGPAIVIDEAGAAQAAAALLRRIGKFGPSTPLEDTFESWRISMHGRDGVRGGCSRRQLRGEDHREGVIEFVSEDAVSAATPGIDSPFLEKVAVTSAVVGAPQGCVAKSALRRSSSKFDSRCVGFNLAACTVHEVTPYCEVYGRHPREFVFDGQANMLPAGGRFGFVGLNATADDDEDYSEEEDDA